MIFTNRQDAGRRLAEKLKKYQGKNAIVFALPRGGVITAKEISKKLHLPLDLIIVRKIGHPANPEYAIGAITESGKTTGDPIELSGVDPSWLKQKKKEEIGEAKRRRSVYLEDKKPLSAKGRIAIIVDDGIATGWTMLAAIKAVKNQNPKKIIVAVPIAPIEIAEKLKKEADEFIAAQSPEFFLGAVGIYYKSFPPVSDSEVKAALKDLLKF